MLGQLVFIAFALLVDFTCFILGILVVGVIINPIISVIVTGIFLGYARAKGLGVESWKVYASTLGTAVGESIPLVNLLPFFTLNAWHIIHAVKVKEKKEQVAVETQAQAVSMDTKEQERQEWIANYQAQQQAEQEEQEAQEEQDREVQEMEQVREAEEEQMAEQGNPSASH